LQPIYTKVKVIDYYYNSRVYYETEIFIEFGVEHYISLNPDLKKRFMFLFYNKEGALILSLDNEYKNEESIFTFLDDVNIINL